MSLKSFFPLWSSGFSWRMSFFPTSDRPFQHLIFAWSLMNEGTFSLRALFLPGTTSVHRFFLLFRIETLHGQTDRRKLSTLIYFRPYFCSPLFQPPVSLFRTSWRFFPQVPADKLPQVLDIGVDTRQFFSRSRCLPPLTLFFFPQTILS